MQQHWLTLRKLDGAWYNFNSLYPAPEFLGALYLTTFLATLKEEGYSIFVVKGQLPGPHPDAGNTDTPGHWFTPTQVRTSPFPGLVSHVISAVMCFMTPLHKCASNLTHSEVWPVTLTFGPPVSCDMKSVLLPVVSRTSCFASQQVVPLETVRIANESWIHGPCSVWGKESMLLTTASAFQWFTLAEVRPNEKVKEEGQHDNEGMYFPCMTHAGAFAGKSGDERCSQCT